jgi:hypothetical protein
MAIDLVNVAAGAGGFIIQGENATDDGNAAMAAAPAAYATGAIRSSSENLQKISKRIQDSSQPGFKFVLAFAGKHPGTLYRTTT